MDRRIYEKILSLPEWKKAKKVFIYISTSQEVSTRRIIETSFGVKKIIVPKSHEESKTLTLHEINSFDETSKGHYSIQEPLENTKVVIPEEIDIAIVPGVVFDKKGHRIGYGKAYYDGLLPSIKCKKIGLAYELQIVENIPAQEHDVPVDIIITEKEIRRIC